MKKIIAILLTFVILFSLIPAGTTAKAAELGDKPFYCVSMGSLAENPPFVYSQPFPYSGSITAETEWPNVTWGEASGEYEIAEKMAQRFSQRPKGTRYFQLGMVQLLFRNQAENVVFFDKAGAIVEEWFTEFIKEFHRLGGEIDGVITDLEYIGGNSYYIKQNYNGTNGKTKNINVYRDIVADPRYKTRIRPLLEEYGFKFFEGTDIEKGHCEIFCVHSAAGESGHEKCSAVWSYVADRLEREAITDAVLKPLLEYYPDATVSDYQSATLDTWYEAVDNHGNKISFNTVGAGNVSDINTYVGRPQISFFGAKEPVYNNPPSYNKAVFDPTPFKVTNYDLNLFKNLYASTDDRVIDAWHADYFYSRDAVEDGYGGTYCFTPYYSELLYHIGLLNPQVFLGYIIEKDVQKNGGTLQEALQIVSDIMAELTRVAGASDREPILIPETAAYWNASYMLSGMYAAGRNIWRITPDTTQVSVENFKVEGTDPTFYVDGLTVTFPQGKIVEDGKVFMAGTCGYWVETPKGVNPIVTADPDRISKYPAFLADFEDYEIGTEFTSGLALPKTCWNVGGTASIQANGDGKALAVKGNTVISNVKLPPNISAGDDYAMQQIWESTVILPEGLKAEAELKLFSTQETDGGLKINDGKVYYDEKGTYKQIEGVTLTAGTAYTLRREIDFRDYDTFYSDYSVYDASGKLLGKVNDVPMNAFDLPITSITMYTNHVNVPILIDDYKLYATGVNTVFELYETEKGTKITDTSAALTKSTTYRLSWMNATTGKAKAIVYNVDTGEIIETIEMAPGMDGVNYKNVEITADKPIKLAVKTEAEAIPDIDAGNGTQDGNNQPGDGNQPGGNTEPATKSAAPVIIGVVAAVVVVVAAVVVFVILKKKRTADTSENNENE